MVVAIVVLAVVGGGIAFLVIKNPGQPASVGSTTLTTPTTPSANTLPPGSAASAIGLQPTDLGPGFIQGAAGSALSTPSAAGPCTPLSSQPWLADVSSPIYTAGDTGPYVYSTVVIMPTVADAQNALTAVSAPSYGPNCYEPTFDAAQQQSISATNQQTTCNLQFVGSTISPIPIGAAGSGTSGWTYKATILCGATNTTSSFYVGVVSRVVGRVFVQAIFRTGNDPIPTSLEKGLISAMAARAQSKVPN